MDAELLSKDASCNENLDVPLTKELIEVELNHASKNILGNSDGLLRETIKCEASSVKDNVLITESNSDHENNQNCVSVDTMLVDVASNGVTTSASDTNTCVHKENLDIEVLNPISAEITDTESNRCIEDKTEITDSQYNSNYDTEYSFKQIPFQITGAWKEFSSTARNNYTRGCKW